MKKHFTLLKKVITLFFFSYCSTAIAQINTWQLINGSDTDPVISVKAIYGTKSQAAASNTPGSRSGFITWVDSDNNLWLFGGYTVYAGENFLGDLWNYNTTSNMWTWISGDSTPNKMGNYGTKGYSSDTIFPSSRHGGAGWSDNQGNIWLFGGIRGDYYPANDLWKYNISNNEWTWVGGSSSSNGAGIYGIKGIGSVTNIPGSGGNFIIWTTPSGLFYLFGGDGKGGGEGDDLWQYNP